MARVELRLDKSAFTVKSFAEADEEDRDYWRSRSPRDRLEALEIMRRLNYDYDPATDRIQRTIEVVEQV